MTFAIERPQAMRNGSRSDGLTPADGSLVIKAVRPTSSRGRPKGKVPAMA